MKYVFSEQVIEHLTYEQGAIMLNECRRVLVPGGKIRIATPNLTELVGFFGDPKNAAFQAYFQRQAKKFGDPVLIEPETFTLNRMMHFHGHQFLYTLSLLRQCLQAAGFRDIKEVQPGKSDDPALTNIDSGLNGKTTCSRR